MKFLYCRSCGLIKNNTCMVNRQRQSKITHNGSERIRFSRFASVLQIASRRTPKCSPPSCFRYTVLGNDVQSRIYLDESARLASLNKHVALEFLKISVEDMDFERHSASHFGVILYES